MLVAGVCALSTVLILIAGSVRAQVYTLLNEDMEEPEMPTYQHYPIFQTGSISPRIMIVLDNSASMNFPAYGIENEVEDFPNGKEITSPYAGLECKSFSTRIKHSADDGQEQKNTGQIRLCSGISTLTMLDLDLGRDDDYYGGSNCKKSCSCNQPMIVGMRFTDISIPKEVEGVPVKIKKAFIEFVARDNEAPQKNTTTGFTVTITAEANDNPAAMSWAKNNISSRPDTTESVVWNIPDGAWEHRDGSNYTTISPDLTAVVQELIDRPGWNLGNAMFFKIDPTGGEVAGRPVHSFDSNNQLSPRLIIEYEPCLAKKYYGYFDPLSRYSYSNMFDRDPNGQWDGNFLNFLTMRRGDVLRKALAGGLSTSRTGGGGQTQIGINDAKASPECDFKRHHVGAGDSPWGDAWYFMTIPNNGVIQVRATENWSDPVLGEFTIQVVKDPIEEPDSFSVEEDPDARALAGVFQKIGDRAQWGDAWFMSGTELNVGKAEVQYAMDQNINNMTTTIKNTPFETETPIAEALYVITQYFAHEDAEISGYHTTAIGPFNCERDPFCTNDQDVDCAGAYCLLLTDGMSTYDQHVPDYLKTFADGAPIWFPYPDNSTGVFPDSGSDFAQDVALYMRTTDLRSATKGRSDLPGEQNVILYVVYALGNDPMAETLLKNTAVNGGFYDRNGNDLPDLKIEWDENGDGMPDNYFEAKDGDSLEDELMNAILAILKRAGSGTAVSVLATKGEGEGTLVQAIFNPAEATEAGEVAWTGMLHSLWVDDYGMIREDTDQDFSLNPDMDERILFDTDNSSETVIRRYKKDAEDPYDTVPISELNSLWSAGRKLAETEPAFRNIFTYRGDGTEADPNTKFIQINNNFWNLFSIINLLGVNSATWDYLGVDEVSRAVNINLWMSGVPHQDSSYYGTVELRNRTLDDGTLWKLGDIIHSTPTSMAQPLSDYDLLYSDQSYYEYYMKNRDRETVVFVGSNDGMLHAFTGWVYDGNKFVDPYDLPGYFTNHTDNLGGGDDIGNELWAYIPQAVLPHLKWLANTEYTHVNYVDLRPRVFDAKIFTPSATHPNGWGTVLVCGLGFAGGLEIPCNPKHADASKRLKMHPSFFAFDVTEPRSPVFMWERGFPGQAGMSANYPNLLMVDGEWMIAIGSGPSANPLDGNGMEGKSAHDASLIIVDLKTGGNTAQGGLKNIFTLPGGNAFTNEPVGFDKNLNYNADSVIVAANYNDDTSQVFRLTIPQEGATEFEPWDDNGTVPTYVSDPADPGWTIEKLFKSPRPITASASMSIDRRDNSWIYLGTGRYMTDADKSTDNQNYIIGIKDPFFNRDYGDRYKYPFIPYEINSQASVDAPLDDNEMFDADQYTVYGRSDVDGPDGKITFDDMLTTARHEDYHGWYRRLRQGAGTPSERVINKGAVLGGILLKPTFTPNSDICGFGGTSRLFAVFYETGTAFFRKVFLQHDNDGPILDVIDLGDGLASSLSIHSGRQTGGKVYVQKSTGEIMEVDVDPAFKIKSGPEYWLDDGYY